MIKILIKKSGAIGAVPASSQLDPGEIAINFRDGFLFFKDYENNIQRIPSSLNSSMSELGTQNRIAFYSQNNAISSCQFFIVGNNNNLGIGDTPPAQYRVYVSGNSFSSNYYTSGQYFELSSIQFKKDLQKIEGKQQKKIAQALTTLKVYAFEKNTKEVSDAKEIFEEKKELGVLAEDIQSLFPEFELVKENSLSYARLSVLCIIAIKELKEHIARLEKRFKQINKNSNKNSSGS